MGKFGFAIGLPLDPFLEPGFYFEPDLEFFLGGLGGTAYLLISWLFNEVVDDTLLSILPYPCSGLKF